MGLYTYIKTLDGKTVDSGSYWDTLKLLKYLRENYQEVNKEENTFINMGGFQDQDTYDFKLTINDLKIMKKNKALNNHTINELIKEIKKIKIDIFIISIW